MNPEFNPDAIKIIVGLGNPGQEYANTFHNVGQIVLSSLVSTAELKTPRPSFSYVKYGGRIIVIPQVFMNESGIAVKDALSYFKANPEELLIVQDDADLFLGESKLQFARGDAGHNGIKSIMKELDTTTLWRFRIGIRREQNETEHHIKAKSFVLNSITAEDKKLLENAEKELLKLF